MARLTVEQFTNLTSQDISKMKRGELARAVQDAAAVAKKRINRLEPRGTEYIKRWKYDIEHYSTKGQKLNQLREEAGRLQMFLRAKSSTSRGLREIQKETAERIGYEGYAKLSAKQQDEWWVGVEKISELYKDELDLSSDEIQAIAKVALTTKLPADEFNKLIPSIALSLGRNAGIVGDGAKSIANYINAFVDEYVKARDLGIIKADLYENDAAISIFLDYFDARLRG